MNLELGNSQNNIINNIYSSNLAKTAHQTLPYNELQSLKMQ
jgi:hypothetical protein